MTKSFSAQIEDWVRKSNDRMTAVFRTAAQDVANDVRKPKADGGHMPIDTGNLRRSFSVSTDAMPQTKEGEFSDQGAQITISIASAEIGDTLYMGFQAVYAARMEYGFDGTDSLGRTYKQPGNGFVRLTAQRWPEIVDQAAAKVKARVK